MTNANDDDKPVTFSRREVREALGCSPEWLHLYVQSRPNQFKPYQQRFTPDEFDRILKSYQRRRSDRGDVDAGRI